MKKLEKFLSLIPSVKVIESWIYDNWNWWIKIYIDISHKLSWQVVQELWHILNYLSVEERLPTSFLPVSSPPYLNGWPEKFLYWIIASADPSFTKEACLEWLEGRLPRPVENIENWISE